MRVQQFLFLSAIAAISFLPGTAPAQNASRIGSPIDNPGSWFNDIDTPAEAIARGETGATKVELEVSTTGEVSGCKVVESSGSQLLDDGTCATAKLHGRFQPQLDASGKPVPFTYTLPRIRYTMSHAKSRWSAGEGRRLISNQTVRLSISAAGIVESCRSLNADTPDASACSDYAVGRAIPGYPANAGARTVTLSQTSVMDAAAGK
jgi:TonB family protein